jgi:hypothetical protein
MLVAATVSATMAGSAQAPYFHTFRLSAGGIRPAALADASNADANDVTSMFRNPGSVSFVKNVSVVYAHISEVGTHAATEQVTVSLPRAGRFAFALNALVMHGGMLDPEGAPVTDFRSTGGDICASYLLLPTISAGVIGGVRSMSIGEERRMMGWGLMGVFYYPSPGISYGLTYGAERGVIYWYANAQSGLFWEDDATQHLEIGATMSFPPRAKESIVTLSLAAQKVFPGVSLFNTKGGLEISPVPWATLRIGFKVGSNERVARYGFGFRFSRASVDFAFAPSAAEHRFGGLSVMVDL